MKLTTNYKNQFIELALQCGALKFGEFILKSGRLSHYFFNIGAFCQGQTLEKLGNFYAHKLVEEHINCQHLFGPAYKGLPLATATAVALTQYGINASVSFNRKEIKDHGEGGQLIGATVSNNMVMIDDVITAGTAFRQSQSLVTELGGKITTVIIALDRCERGQGEQSTLAEIETHGVRVVSLITLFDLIVYLEQQEHNITPSTVRDLRIWAEAKIASKQLYQSSLS